MLKNIALSGLPLALVASSAIANEGPNDLLINTPFVSEVLEEIVEIIDSFTETAEVVDVKTEALTARVSYYGKGFDGRRTASGYKFNHTNPDIVAHLTLPFGTKVRFCNTAAGKCLVSTVRDYGPCHNNRLFDVSEAAAIKLGFRQQGVAELEYEILELGPKERRAIICPTRGLRYG